MKVLFKIENELRNELKWNDKIVIENGIKDTVLWIKNNIEVLSLI